MKTYGRLATEFYELQKTGQDAAAEIDFYLGYARVAAGPVLEPMCGTGRILLPLLAAGIDVEGFDASTEMLAVLREKYNVHRHGEPPVWQQYVQDFSSDRRYALIFIPFGSWGLILDVQQRTDALCVLYNHLLPGGRLLLEIDMEDSVRSSYATELDKVHRRADGSLIALRVKSVYDPATQRYTAECSYIDFDLQLRARATELETFEQHIFRFGEMESILSNVGFCSIQRYADYHKRPVIDGEEAPRIIYECVKK